ncbi:cell division protein FtsZ [Kordiimonas laminariae]|uniref:cell division protein FtsZ n=1 Tax=Kordiimonas laminariae TaxID=2917717 RepID=UPI001FF6E879|nr:cell division protein FtsZ [Kordiimonas laminariae]MCK0068656.1 cell division protein FtsZ [Kordiimonas laminariae]
MSIEFGNTELTEITPRIAVVGVGGAGCNAVNNMISAQLQGVDFVVANTDAQSLAASAADNRIQLGIEITQGLGAGAQPKIGAAAAEEAVDSIDETLNGCHMAFVTAGMGGGTGTGAAPVIARRAREKGILTVGVVTRPFQFEGGRRAKIADSGIAELAQNVDTLIIIPNQNLFRVANERTTFADAFNMADEVLHSGVRGITDLMVMPGLINLDFADVRTVMSEMGKAMMGTGEAEGETRAQDAAAAAISNPLLEEASLKGAKGVIINVTGGMDMTLYEVDEAVNMVREQVDPDALIVFGSAFNQDLEGKLRVSVVATGIEGGAQNIEIPVPVRKPEPAPEPVVEETAVEETEEAAEVAETAEEHDAIPMEEEKSVADILGEVQASLDDRAEQAVSEQPEMPRETEDLEEKALAKAEQADAFVAEAPMMPKETLAQPAGQAEAPLVDAYTAEPKVEEEPKPEPSTPQKRSLFQVMTAGLRGGNTEVSASERVNTEPEAVETTSSLGGVTEEDRSAPKTADKDQLEIPSFLRRQQN